MNQLTDFCNSYIPHYFDAKYKDRPVASHFHDFKSPQNIYELTTGIFGLVDQLLSANPELQVTKIIREKFIFIFSDFDLECKSQTIQNSTRELIRNILKQMKRNRHRQLFQLHLRILYIYFDSKQTAINSAKTQIRNNYMDEIKTFYIDLKLKTMTTDDTFVPMDFMQYIIRLILNMKPNEKFIQFVIQLMSDCQFPDIYQEKIKEKIRMNKKRQNIRLFQEMMPNKLALESDQHFKRQNNAKIQNKQSNQRKTHQNEDSQKLQKTPVKQKSAGKIQRNTHESSQKKDKLTQNDLSQPKSLDGLKISLQMKMPRKSATPTKQRTIYLKNKYFVQKRPYNNEKISSIGSHNEEICLRQLNRSYSSRCIPVDHQNDDFLVGETPKPKKKLKLERSSTEPFDDKRNFIRKI